MQAIVELQKITKELSDKSVHFANYIDSIGGIEQMEEDVNNENIKAIAKWLPFACAYRDIL